MKAKFATLVLAAALVSGTAMAQGTTAAAPAKQSFVQKMIAAKKAKAAAAAAAKPAATKAAAPVAAKAAAAKATVNNGQTQQRTAKSLACSKQADSKNIHGQARKSFMEKCKKA